MSGGFSATVSFLAQGMVILTIAAPAIILCVMGLALAGRSLLRRFHGKSDSRSLEGGASREVLISGEGWGKQIHRAGSAAAAFTTSVATGRTQEAGAMAEMPALGELPAVDDGEPERRRA